MLKNRGFTLVEVAIAMGILSLGALAIAQYSMNASRAVKNNQLSGEMAILVSNIQGVLGSSACTAVLSGQIFQLGNPISIILPGGTIVAQQNLPTVGAQVQTLTVTSIIQDNVTVAGNLVERLVNLQLTAKKVLSPTETKIGTLGAQTITKNFPIAIWVDTGPAIPVILACSQPVQTVPVPPTTFTLDGSPTPTCIDTSTPFAFDIAAPAGTLYVSIQPEVRQSPYPTPQLPINVPNPNFSTNPLNPPGFTAVVSPMFSPIPNPNPSGYNFYATAYNSANQALSPATTGVVIKGTCP